MADAEIIWHGEESLRPLLLPIDDLVPMENNPNDHPPLNLRQIGQLLRDFGQLRLLVVKAGADGRFIVHKGNGTLEAAKELGWSHLACTKTDLDDESAKAYAVADNASARHSRDDDRAVKALLAGVEASGIDLHEFMPKRKRTKAEATAEAEGAAAEETGETEGKQRWVALVTLHSRQEMMVLQMALAARGFKSRQLK